MHVLQYHSLDTESTAASYAKRIKLNVQELKTIAKTIARVIQQ